MTIVFVLPAWFAAFTLFRRMFPDQREAALGACIIWGVLIVVLTEVLSMFYALAFVPLLITWGVISCASLAICCCVWRRNLGAEQLKKGLFRRDNIAPAILIAGISSIFTATLVVALLSPPNNWDSMTYHMTRVANWIDHRSIRDYPTHILRELYLGPWAEFAITHLQILAGGDRFANCVQYLAMLGSVCGVSLLAKKLGAEYKGQLLASVFCATIPMGILQASSTQNDYVTAFWLLCFLNFTLDLIFGTCPGAWGSAALAGASLGLAVLTKVTALVFAAPFLGWVTFVLLRRRGVRAAFLLGAMSAVALSINSGHFIRNELVFSSVLGDPVETALYRNTIHTPAAVTSNVIRNLAVHLAVPKIGSRIKTAVLRVHRLTGLDINDDRTTFTNTTFDYGVSLSEDFAGNPLHLLLAAFGIIVVFWGLPRNHVSAIYSSCILGGFLLFCGYLKWHPWVSRFHLPLFVAVAPICGVVFSRGTFFKIGYLASISILCVGALYAVRNAQRPLIGRPNILIQPREDMYFATRRNIRQPFFAAAAEVARDNPSRVGIITGPDDWEYPFRVLARRRLRPDAQFEHVSVRNESRNCLPEMTSDHSLPRKVVVIGSFLPENLPPGYKPVFVSPSIRVYMR